MELEAMHHPLPLGCHGDSWSSATSSLSLSLFTPLEFHASR